MIGHAAVISQPDSLAAGDLCASVLDIGDRATDLGVLLDGQLSMALHQGLISLPSLRGR